jgi:hypothetical protein
MSNSSIKESEERVRRMLRDGFADVPCPDVFKEMDSCLPVIHEVCLELRKDFYNYEPEEIRFMLPSVLEDLMDTRTGDDIETEDAERLVLQLNPYFHNDAVIRKVKLDQFADFTREQAQAVCEWLRLAHSWRDLERFRHWVDASITYWCDRASV